MISESMQELAAAAPQELRPIILNACLESALLRSFHESSAFACLSMTGQSARRYGSGLVGLCSSPASEWGELSFRLVDKKGYYPERWLFKAQRYLRFMGIDSRIGFTRKTASHVGWIRAPGLAEVAGFNETTVAGLAGRSTAAGQPNPQSLGAAPPGIKFFIDTQGSPDKVTSPGRVIVIEGWGECFSLRLDD
jgi:hypothetical protein